MTTPDTATLRELLVPGEFRDFLYDLLYAHDPSCGGEDCGRTADRITPLIEERLGLPALLSRITELEAALRPFADVGAYLESETMGFEADEDLMLVTTDQAGRSHGMCKVKFGAFDLARSTLDGAK